MPGIDFAALRARITMDEVLDLLNFQPVQHVGSRVRGACLFQCGGSPRDFVANLARRRYRCFHCHRNGNHLDLWAKVHQQSFYDAAHALCRQLRIHPPLKRRG